MCRCAMIVQCARILGLSARFVRIEYGSIMRVQWHGPRETSAKEKEGREEGGGGYVDGYDDQQDLRAAMHVMRTAIEKEIGDGNEGDAEGHTHQGYGLLMCQYSPRPFVRAHETVVQSKVKFG